MDQNWVIFKTHPISVDIKFEMNLVELVDSSDDGWKPKIDGKWIASKFFSATELISVHKCLWLFLLVSILQIFS